MMENLRWKSSCNKLEALGCGDEAKLTDEDYEKVMSIEIFHEDIQSLDGISMLTNKR